MISGSLAWSAMFMAYVVCSSIPVFEAQKLTSAYRFRRAITFNSGLSSLRYNSLGQPYTTCFALSILVLLFLTNGSQDFFLVNFPQRRSLRLISLFPFF